MLSVTEAVRRRHSVRAFRADPVPRGVIEEILEIAARAPSGGNLQPWHVDILAGSVLEELKTLARDRLGAGLEMPEFNVYPPSITPAHAGRRRQCGEDLYSSIGIARDAKPGRWGQFL